MAAVEAAPMAVAVAVAAAVEVTAALAKGMCYLSTPVLATDAVELLLLRSNSNTLLVLMQVQQLVQAPTLVLVHPVKDDHDCDKGHAGDDASAQPPRGRAGQRKQVLSTLAKPYREWRVAVMTSTQPTASS